MREPIDAKGRKKPGVVCVCLFRCLPYPAVTCARPSSPTIFSPSSQVPSQTFPSGQGQHPDSYRPAGSQAGRSWFCGASPEEGSLVPSPKYPRAPGGSGEVRGEDTSPPSSETPGPDSGVWERAFVSAGVSASIASL